MNRPKVSVLMSVWNGAGYLKESIQSILDQTFNNFELVIIDDGSTDATSDVLRTFRDPRIRKIKNDVHLGLTSSLNIGLAQSKGQYIARMDCDDLSLPKRLEKQVEFLDKDKSFKLVGSWTEIINSRGIPVDAWTARLSPEEIYYTLHFRNCLTHSGVMFDRALSLELRGYNKNLDHAQDYEFWTRFNEKTRIMQLEEILIKRRETASNISNLFRKTQKANVRTTMGKILTGLTGKMIKKEFLSMMGDDLTPLINLSQTERMEFLECLEQVHRALLINRKDFVDLNGFLRVLEKRKLYFLERLFPEKAGTPKNLFLKIFSRLVRN